ncbi:hypothetical protein F4604DRAFT_1919098 [Suillus subluteus]|nr:hypothetical protein F4604DRAFT_1919098 [Suillus subluteus]
MLFQAGKPPSTLMINNPALSSAEISGPNETTTTHSLREIIEANLYIDVNSLSANIIIATKSPDRLINWIELKPKFHCSIVKCFLQLISKHTAKFKSASAKEALFQFLINLLNGRATCTAFFHETKTAMAPKHANRESRCKDTEKLKAQAKNRKKSEVNVNDAEAKKTPLQTPNSNPAITIATSGPSPIASEKNPLPTPLTLPTWR